MCRHFIFLGLVLHVSVALAFLQECRGITSQRVAIRPQMMKLHGLSNKDSNNEIQLQRYQHKSFNLTYLYKEAAPGREKDRPIILVHPVGIGLSSWFWKRLMDSYKDNPPIYAPDLIGCGIDHGADAWDPEAVGLFFPLSWVEGVETLMNEIVLPKWRESQNSLLPSVFGLSRQGNKGYGCLVIAQGGLASVGIMLAQRNPLTVSNLMLTSPPTYKDVTTAIPTSELRRNYEFLRSTIFGYIAFNILESRALIKFFSNRFLFQDECDEEWLDETGRESVVAARTPVQAFNAGLLQHRSFEVDLKESPQPKLIVSGEGDKRAVDRQPYKEQLDSCTLVTIPGLNVLPWESPDALVNLIKELGC
jgi:pimeloyl-ACP methyl ester carboxylesterase